MFPMCTPFCNTGPQNRDVSTIRHLANLNVRHMSHSVTDTSKRTGNTVTKLPDMTLTSSTRRGHRLWRDC